MMIHGTFSAWSSTLWAKQSPTLHKDTRPLENLLKGDNNIFLVLGDWVVVKWAYNHFNERRQIMLWGCLKNGLKASWKENLSNDGFEFLKGHRGMMKNCQIVVYGDERAPNCWNFGSNGHWTSQSNQAKGIVHLGIQHDNVDYECGNWVGQNEVVWLVVAFFDGIMHSSKISLLL